MKKIYYLLFVACMALTACDKPVGPDEPVIPPDPTDTTETGMTKWEVLDTTYTVAKYTVPSHTAFKIALTKCVADSSEANKAALDQAIQNLFLLVYQRRSDGRRSTDRSSRERDGGRFPERRDHHCRHTDADERSAVHRQGTVYRECIGYQREHTV